MTERQGTILLGDASEELVFIELKRQLPELASCVEFMVNNIKKSEFTNFGNLANLLTEYVGQVRPGYGISVVAGLANLVRYVTRTRAVASLEASSPGRSLVYYVNLSDEHLEFFKPILLKRVKEFALMTTWACKVVPMLAQPFISECPRRTILVYGYSTMVLEVLKKAKSEMHVEVFCTVGSPSRNGLQFRMKLLEHGISAHTLDDAAVAHHMPDIDMVLVGANGVDESGGIINQVGTYQIAVVALHANVPVYVVAERFKFGVQKPEKVNDEYDYTEPGYIAQIISDSGILSPSEISGELTKLYEGHFSLIPEL